MQARGIEPSSREPWLAYALALLSMLALVLSGMLDDEGSRVIAGWIGLGAVIAAITWTVRGSLLCIVATLITLDLACVLIRRRARRG